MANVTVDENHPTIENIFCIPGPYEVYQQVLFVSLNITLGIVVFLGNALVIAALQKASSLSSSIETSLLLPCEHRSWRRNCSAAPLHFSCTVSKTLQTLDTSFNEYLDRCFNFLQSTLVDTHCTKFGESPHPEVGAKIQTSDNFFGVLLLFFELLAAPMQRRGSTVS